jgi:hypothetical protein
MAVIRPVADDTAVGNLVLLTELKMMHVLDVYGHAIVKSFNIDVVAHEAFAFGVYPTNYTVVCVGRCNSVLIIENVVIMRFRVNNVHLTSKRKR